VTVRKSITTNEALSPIILRPDFEEQHEESFREALSYYHCFEYEAANKIVNDSLQHATENHLFSGLSSFTFLHHFINLKEPCKWSGPLFTKQAGEDHIENIISNLAECAREWIFHKKTDCKYRKKDMDDDIPFAFDVIHEWIPMPPIEGTKFTDLKVSQSSVQDLMFAITKIERYMVEFYIII
jgi:hypothetical protein